MAAWTEPQLQEYGSFGFAEVFLRSIPETPTNKSK